MAIPAVLLVGLWGYAATGLVAEQLQVRDDTSLAASVGGPAHTVLSRLQDERRLTVTWQAAQSESSRAALEKARSSTDSAVEGFRRRSYSMADDKGLREKANGLTSALDQLTKNRSAIDRRTLSEVKVFTYYTDTITAGVGVIDEATRLDDGRFARAGEATASLVQVSEMISREDALLSNALASGELSSAARTQFAQYLAIQRQVRTSLVDSGDLPEEQAAALGQFVEGQRWKTLAQVEDAVVSSRSGTPPRQADGWRAAADALGGELDQLGSDSLDSLADEGSDRAGTLLIQAILGSLAVVAAVVVTAALVRRAARGRNGRLADLQRQIEELGQQRLPRILMQLEQGQAVTPEEEPPALGPDADDMARLSASIHRLGQEFESALVRQARGREGTEEVFANLTRRTQILVHRLISLLDDLERKHEDSDLLQDIFKVDHLATRVRRHSENLVILSGSRTGRRGNRPLSITDVVRGAVSETEQYRRVAVKSLPPGRQVTVAARAVTDITHLLAELIENGTTFSPPDTQVQISATKVARGLVLHVEDHGLGMPQEQYEQLNEVLAKPPQPDMDALGKDPRLGLFVVAKLAERHGIKVSLRESGYGGTLAIVLLPSSLLEEQESALPKELKAASSANDAPERDVETTVVGAVTAAGAVPTPSAAPPLDPPPAVLPFPGPRQPMDAGPVRAQGNAAPPSEDVAAPVPAMAAAVGLVTSDPGQQFTTHGGFPDYGGAGLLPSSEEGGAGLLPSSSEGLAAHVPPPSGWTPGQEHTDQYTDYVAPSAAPVAQGPSQPLEDPQVLPMRTRGASLAKQLREEAGPPRRDADKDLGAMTPGRSAANLMAIQRETRRARDDQDSRSAELDGSAESRQHGTDEL